MANLTLKQFRYFEALARQRHFGRAAEVCAISQPALSMQIKELETELGAALFERSPRDVRLTQFGETFAERIGKILLAVDGLQDLARAAQSGLGPRLRLGVIPTIAPYLLPRLIGRIQGQYPDLDLQFRESTTPRLVEELGEGKIDSAILALPLAEQSLVEVPLFDENFVLVRPESDKDARTGTAPDVCQLRKMRLLLLEEGHCFRDQALSFCNIPSGLPRDGLDGSSLSTLVQMVGAGLGVTLLPDMAVKVETRSAPVHVSRFAGLQPSRTVGMVWRKSNPLGDRLRDLADLVKDASQPVV